MALKPDIVIKDRESKQKCSIEPLRGRPDLLFFHSEQLNTLQPDIMEGYLFLHVEGQPLTEADFGQPLLLLDASWRRAFRLAQLPIFHSLSKRCLPEFLTSYPRVSKLYALPHGGLASVEALYVARLIQGREEPMLLEHYHWREQFLQLNHEKISHWQNLWLEKKNEAMQGNSKA